MSAAHPEVDPRKNALEAFARIGLVSVAIATLVPACKSREHDAATPPSDTTHVADAASMPVDGRARTFRDLVTLSGEMIATEQWTFALSDVDVTIEDVHMKRDLAGLLRATGAVFATNGGFFGRNAEPLGLAISGGKTLSRFSPQMSGGVLLINDGRATLSETESFDAGPVDAGASGSFAIQCKPRLVVHHQANIKTDDGQRAERTALCIRDDGRTLEIMLAKGGRDGGPSLFDLAAHLAATGCEEALNLDGGPSTGVAWLNARDGDALVDEPPRGPIRHAIVITPRAR